MRAAHRALRWVLAASLLLVASAGASTSGSWTAPAQIDDPSNPPNAAALNSISCSNPAFCIAADAAGSVLRYDGRAWSAGTDLENGSTVPLVSVSCPTRSFCVVVDSIGQAFAWNGRAWSKPVTIDSDQGLSSVSCASKRFCMAVGSAEPPGSVAQSYALSFNGRHWSKPTLLDPRRSLTAVSCPRPEFCTAVDDHGGAV